MIDDLDKKIIRIMNRNARKSFREIAKEVGTSAPVVIHAVKKMENLGAIKGYIPDIDAGHFGFDLMAIIALRISQGKLLETQKKIARIPQVAGVYDITGEWDSLVIAYFKGREDLNDFLKKLNVMRFIGRTVTHIVLNIVKDERRVFV
jgi:Lrp/AsnC family transcriptional regulator for asnA, asnC and gidA